MVDFWHQTDRQSTSVYFEVLCRREGEGEQAEGRTSRKTGTKKIGGRKAGRQAAGSQATGGQIDRRKIDRRQVYILKFCTGERGRGSRPREEQAGRQVPGR